MLAFEPTGETLGATVRGIDLKADMTAAEFGTILKNLGEYGVLRFPNQALDAAALRRFSARFGEIQVLKGVRHHEPGMPEVTILSNVVAHGEAIGAADAGQSWHTDMTYPATRGFVNVLSAWMVPERDGKPVGQTEFTNTQAAAADLPADLVKRLEGRTATHDIEMFWEYMRREKGSKRPPMSPEMRAQRPPVHHPVLMKHPITGRNVIYVNPGFTTKIDGLPDDESADVLKTLIDHVFKPKYRYLHSWQVGDLLLWDNLGSWHFAHPDYRPNEYRLMKRCQVMADKIFDPAFVRDALAHAA